MVGTLRIAVGSAALVAFVTAGGIGGRAQSAPQRPIFEVDPAWPTIPAGWSLGQVSSAAADANDHIWVLHRSRVIRAGQRTGPAVM